MYSVRWTVLISIVCYLDTVPVAATTSFPEKILEAIADGSISTPTLAQMQPTFQAFSYEEQGESNYLIEYFLGSGSRESTHFSSTTLAGSLWLGVQASYDLSDERHYVDLYLDRVSPPPTNESNIWVGDSDGLDVQLSLVDADLLGGEGFMNFEDLPDGSFVFTGELGTHGDTYFDPTLKQSLLPCLDATCAVGARLNLVYLHYEQANMTAVLTINSADSRSLVYTQYRDYDEDNTWHREQTYDVAPEPGTLLMVGWAIACLASWRRHTGWHKEMANHDPADKPTTCTLPSSVSD
jgi:hypothetical protein